jgi:hypothetical protein
MHPEKFLKESINRKRARKKIRKLQETTILMPS